jgi:hypothetical protein
MSCVAARNEVAQTLMACLAVHRRRHASACGLLFGCRCSAPVVAAACGAA